MALPRIPIHRYLVPETKPQAPAGFTLVDEPLVTGLPYAILLGADTRLLVTLPTGLAVTWRDADPTLPVSQSNGELTSVVSRPDEPVGNAERAPLRLLLQDAGVTLASVPLAVGLRRFLPDDGEANRGVRFEVVVLAWDLRAGSLRGVGDFGSRITLAWRRADQAVEHYSTPPPNPQLVPRLPRNYRLESLVGVHVKLIDRDVYRLKKQVVKP